MTFPDPDWQDLILATVSAVVGWLMNWLGMWRRPSPPKE